MRSIHHPRPRAILAAAILALLVSATAFAQVALPTVPDALHVQAPFRPVATLLAEDFEFDDGGFTTGGNDTWARGIPSVHVQPLAGQGPNVFATNLDGVHGDYECAWLQSPPVDLSAYPPGAETGVSTARLMFRHWFHMEKAWDGGVVMGSADGETWRVLAPIGGYYEDRIIHSYVRNCLGLQIGERAFTGPAGTTPPQPTAWRNAEFDVSAFMGGPMHVRWVFSSDHVSTRLGWYVDDVLVQVGLGAHASAPLPQVDPEQGVEYTPAHTLYAADFAADDGGWTVSGTDAWAWGEPLSPPHPPTGGLNVWGTELTSDYGPDECSYLTSPPIALPGADPAGALEVARLSFDVWRHLSSGYDGAALQVSDDGGATWRLLATDGYDRTLTSSASEPVRECLGVSTTERVWSGPGVQPRAEEWMPVTADLSAYMGEEVLLRFAFGSGSSGASARGVYVANVAIHLGAGGTFSPSRLPTAQPPGWTVVGANPSWGWGMPATGPFSARPVWATNPNGAYNKNECSAIVSDAFETSVVPGLGRLTLAFEHHFRSERYYDAGVVQASADNGATWTTLPPFGDYPGSMPSTLRACLGSSASARAWTGLVTGDQYVPVEADLRAYDGQPVRLRFVFASENTGEDLGWYVRNVQVHRGNVGVPLSLTGAAESPLAAVADASLLDALEDAGAGMVDLVVTGAPHEDVAALAALPRAEALAALDARAAPWLDAVSGAAEALGGETVARWGLTPAVKVRVPAAAAHALADVPGVRAVSADSDDAVRLVEPMPDEPDRHGAGVLNSVGRKMIEAEEMWALGYRGEGITVAVIDTGIDPTHEAFRRADGSSRVAGWIDYTQGAATPYDDHGHGTHVAGTSVGSDHWDDPTWGRFQEVGVAPEATLIVAKFLNAGGSGSLQNGINSLQWAFDEGAEVASNSWGSSCSSGGIPLMQTVRTLTDLGMVSVFAAGNSGPGSGSINGPACSESALTVGAVLANGAIADFSSRGPCRDIDTDTPSRICPDVVAKGAGVRSAIPRSGASAGDPSGYRTWQGTSMATPHIAGAVALVEQMKRDLDGEGWETAARHEEKALKFAALDLGAAGPDDTYGWGLPKLTDVRELLLSVDPVVDHDFGVSRAIVRAGDATTLSFGVRNGAAPVVSGPLRVTLELPDGSETVLRDETVALGLFDETGFTHVFTTGSSTLPGVYTFRASYAYSWTHAPTGETRSALIAREATFEVKRPEVHVELQGFPEDAMPFVAQDLVWTGTSQGNEPAGNVVVEFTLPDGYVFVPRDDYDPAQPLTRYASPAPSAVREDRSFGRVTLVFDVGTLADGESFSFTTRVMPTELGDQRAISVAKFVDGGGKPRAQSHVAMQTVGLPVP